jgi:hypothetical protein
VINALSESFVVPYPDYLDLDEDDNYGFWHFGYDFYYGYGYATNIVDYYLNVAILGSGFPAYKLVYITYCDDNTQWESVETNSCGAFCIGTYVPDDWSGAISVRAWVDDGDKEFDADKDELMATCPLCIEDDD